MKVIYSIINLKNKKQYIGSTTNISRRRNQHLNLLSNNNHHSLSLQASWNKNDPSNYKFIILENVEEEVNIHIREQYYIDLYKSYDKKHGYNIARYAIAPYGQNVKPVYQFSLNGEFIREFVNCVIAADSLKIDCSGLSKCARGKYRFYGGFIWSYDRNLLSNRVKLANNPIRRSDESRKKMSNSAKNRTDNVKPILQLDLDNNILREWKSTSELVKETNYSNGYISDCLHGKHKKAYGYIWKFKL